MKGSFFVTHDGGHDSAAIRPAHERILRAGVRGDRIDETLPFFKLSAHLAAATILLSAAMPQDSAPGGTSVLPADRLRSARRERTDLRVQTRAQFEQRKAQFGGTSWR
jgi:hypothetical protein